MSVVTMTTTAEALAAATSTWEGFEKEGLWFVSLDGVPQYNFDGEVLEGYCCAAIRLLQEGLQALTPHWELCTWEGCLPGGFDAAMRHLDDHKRVKLFDYPWSQGELIYSKFDVYFWDDHDRYRDGDGRLFAEQVLSTKWHVWVEREWVES